MNYGVYSLGRPSRRPRAVGASACMLMAALAGIPGAMGVVRAQEPRLRAPLPDAPKPRVAAAPSDVVHLSRKQRLKLKRKGQHA